ncbi:hypothetical protein MMC27_004452 [Xylographa pallens]|nr:hypothetical protein [Xylographa pallens]
MPTPADSSSTTAGAHRFKTYLEYLDTIKDKWPEYDVLRELLAVYRYDPPKWRVSVRDVLHDGSWSNKVDFEALSFMSEDTERSVSIALNAALHVLPGDGRTRFVLVSDGGVALPTLLLDVLGLSLDIEPLFLWSMLEDSFPSFRPKYSDIWTMGTVGIKLLKGVPRGSGSLPICLIVSHDPISGLFPDFIDAPNRQSTTDDMWRVCQLRFNDVPSIYNHETQEVMSGSYQRKPRSPPILFLDIYDSILSKHNRPSPGGDFLHGLHTMATLQLIRFRQKMSEVYRDPRAGSFEAATDGADDDYPFRLWSFIGNEIDAFRNSSRKLNQIIEKHLETPESSDIPRSIRNDQDEALADAQALETRIRDRLQMKVGRWSLEESRRSIDEGKRVKLLTILAFIFIPISLVASVFGMNVQEINNSGRSIWVFFVTAIILTFIAACLWAVANLFVRWRKVWITFAKHGNPGRWLRMREYIVEDVTNFFFGTYYNGSRADLRRRLNLPPPPH